MSLLTFQYLYHVRTRWRIIPGMCRAKLDSYVFIDFPVFIPWTHQMKVIPGMCRAKLDNYVFVDISIIYTMDAPDEGYSRDVSC